MLYSIVVSLMRPSCHGKLCAIKPFLSMRSRSKSALNVYIKIRVVQDIQT